MIKKRISIEKLSTIPCLSLKERILMKRLILIVEDNPQILKNINLILTFNNYQTLTAINGNDAINVLSKSKTAPDLILSDIMMPEMDGYQLFQMVSQNPSWSSIPFIFLTAKATHDDIRLGKLMGVDDYITKPFKEEDLLASIEGKLKRLDNIQIVNEKLDIPVVERKSKEKIFLYSIWDEDDGPITKEYYPKNVNLPFSIEDIGVQLFQTTAAVYGYDKYDQSYGLLIDLKNICMSAYIFFNSFEDPNVRGGLRQFMLAVLAPKLSYFDSLKLKASLEPVSATIRNKNQLNLEEVWQNISTALTNKIQ